MPLKPQASSCRRRSTRVRAGIPARLWLDVGWQQVICEDVSRDGCGLVVFKPDLRDVLSFPATSTPRVVRLTLQLPEGPVDVAGQLVHRDTGRMGIRFSHVTPEARTSLQRTLSRWESRSA